MDLHTFLVHYLSHSLLPWAYQQWAVAYQWADKVSAKAKRLPIKKKASLGVA